MKVIRTIVGTVCLFLAVEAGASVSAQLSTATDELIVSYKIKNMRSIRIDLYRDSSTLDSDWIIFRYFSKESRDASAGEHVLTFNTVKELGMTGVEFAQKYPNANLVLVHRPFGDGAVADSEETLLSFVFPAETDEMLPDEQVPDDQVSDELEADALWHYKKAAILRGVCFSCDHYAVIEPYGSYEIKVGAINKKTGEVKVSVAVKPFNGGKMSKATRSIAVDMNGDVLGTLSIKPLGSLYLHIAAGADCVWLKEGTVNLGDYVFDRYSTLGGAFEKDELRFSVVRNEPLKLGDGIRELSELDGHPDGAVVYVKNGSRLSVDKAPTISYKKHVSDDMGDDAKFVMYLLKGLDDPKKPNYSNLKLSYTAKTGVFKGSFYVYVVSGYGLWSKPSLKKYKAKVSGVVVDRVGSGTATFKIGSKKYSWTVYLQ